MNTKVLFLFRALNRWLINCFGFNVIRGSYVSKNFRREYAKNFRKTKENKASFHYVTKEFRYEVGHHAENYVDFECSFAADNIASLNPKNILDIGSYRHFIIGLLAYYKVTTVDVRKRRVLSKNETVLTNDAKNLPIPDNSFDMALSLCAIEHFGLGRYGDDIDLSADRIAVENIKRFIKPGGHFVFTTHITKGHPFIAFNAHRVYNYDMIRELCSGLELVNEKIYSWDLHNFCSFNQVTNAYNKFDIYCGCYRK